MLDNISIINYKTSIYRLFFSLRARAGLGLPLLDKSVERRPEFHGSGHPPAGPRPAPEGENNTNTRPKAFNETSQGEALLI